MILFDLNYKHLFYGNFGNISFSLNTEVCKVVSNNGGGKSSFLKIMTGLIIPEIGILKGINEDKNYNKFVMSESRGAVAVSSSQLKKRIISNFFSFYFQLVILDEPFNFLDIASINYIRKQWIKYRHQNGKFIYTECSTESILNYIVFYNELKWI